MRVVGGYCEVWRSRFVKDSLSVVSVELLNDARGVLDDLLVGLRRVLSERLDDAADAHLFERPAALLVDAEVANGEEGNSTWRLRRTLIMSNYIEELLKSSVSD